MTTYDRATRECPVAELRPELYEAIRDYFKEQQLGDPETETIICCETTSTRKDAGRLPAWLDGGEPATSYTGMLLTSQRLVWVRSGADSGMVLTAAALKDIRVKAYTSPLTRDTGLEVCGFVEGSKGRVRGYIGMGPESAAQKFCEAVVKAVEAVNPPAKRRLFGWLLGNR